MKYLDCKGLGKRPASEFVVAGVLDPEPEDLGDVSPGAWVFDRTSVPMSRQEWWYHTPSQLWYLVERNTETDEILSVALASEALHGR